MTRFTDSPYERMMTQRPAGQAKAPASPARPPGHPCHGCPYSRDTPCLGICYRELMKRSDKRAVSGR